MEDTGSKKRENIIHAPYVVRVHEGKWGKKESPPIGEKKRGGRISSFGKPFLPRRRGARYAILCRLSGTSL